MMPAPGEPFGSTLKRLIFLKVIGLRNCDFFGIPQNFSAAYFRRFHAEWGLNCHKIEGPWRAVEEFLDEEVDISEQFLKLDFAKIGGCEDHSATNLLRKFGISFDRYIVIFPGSIAEYKNWGMENFKELVIQLTPLLEKRNIALLVAGPSSDSALAHELRFNDHIFDICGCFSLPELAVILKSSLCSVTVDGGAAHLSAFSGARVVNLSNGAEEPGAFTPVGSEVIEHRNLTDCTPCFNLTLCPLGHSRCVREIRVGDVFESVANCVDADSQQHIMV